MCGRARAKGVECKIKGRGPTQGVGHCLHIVFGSPFEERGRSIVCEISQSRWGIPSGPPSMSLVQSLPRHEVLGAQI